MSVLREILEPKFLRVEEQSPIFLGLIPTIRISYLPRDLSFGDDHPLSLFRLGTGIQGSLCLVASYVSNKHNAQCTSPSQPIFQASSHGRLNMTRLMSLVSKTHEACEHVIPSLSSSHTTHQATHHFSVNTLIV